MQSFLYRRFGVRFALEAPEELLPALEAALPREPVGMPLPLPNAAHDSPGTRRYMIASRSDARHDLMIASRPSLGNASLDDVVARIHADAKFWVSATAVDVCFVHAGVVAFGDGAIVLPGASHAGKTTLVAALLDAGARYFSDDLAVIDASGKVWPFGHPLNVRSERGRALVDPGVVGTRPATVTCVVLTSFRVGATFSPQEVSKAQALLGLLEHAPAVRLQPRRTLGALRAAVATADAFAGERGEAGPAAQWILNKWFALLPAQ